jgi:CubicO group peptidase (beta-lactamase class C family)
MSGVCRGENVARVDSAKIDVLFAKWDRTEGPGLAVGVFVDGEAVHTAGYGMANLDEGIPITPDSVFGTFSLAKSFTTACVAFLLDEGQITLDDNIRQHLTELPEYAETIRIKHLLRCRSGLQDYLHALMLSGRDRDDVWTKAEAFDVICRQKTMPFAAGESFNYSNTDYFLLGLIVERVSGRSLRQFANQRIFSPLGMHNTLFDDDRSQPLKNRVLGYARRADGSYHRIGMNSSTVGAIGLKTTVRDLLQWDRNFRENQLGGGTHLQEFFSAGSLIANNNCLCGYGGQEYRGLKRVCQTGGGPGFLTHFVRFPDHDLSIALMSNLSEDYQWYEMERIVEEIAQLYLGEHFAESPEAVEWDENPNTVQLSPTQLRTKTGGYQKPDRSFVRLVVDQGALAVDKFNSAFPPATPIRLTSLSENRFRASAAHVPYDLAFDADSQEQPDSLTIRYQDGYTQQWKRVEFVSPPREELNAYVGEYSCDNLGAVHRFSVDNRQLFVQFNFGRKQRLVPATADVFVPATGQWDNMRFEFSRDESDDVQSFGVTFERVQYRFERR